MSNITGRWATNTDRDQLAALGNAETGIQTIKHPAHYGGEENPYEAIKVIEAWELGFNLGNVAKYVSRAGKKDSCSAVEDLKKARFYLSREISKLEGGE